MDDHTELREMIQAGRDKIEWYRQVDPTMFRTLQDMMKGKDYLAKMPSIVRVLYEFAFITYAGKDLRSVKFVYYKLMLRFAPRSHQEQQHEEAGGQDPAGDPAPGGEQSRAAEAGGAGGQPGLCHSDWPRLLLWLV